MKKFLFPLLALLAMPVVLTACSDDDDKTPTVNITTGQIPSKNVFVTIDGTYVGTADGVTEITGTVDPAATEQHLQLKCPSMFVLANTGNNIPPLVKNVPTFDITVKTLNGKTTLTGEANGGTITVTGDVTVNYAGENDWRLFFEHKYPTSSPCKLTGKTFEIEFTSSDIYPQPQYRGNPLEVDVEEMTKTLFAKIPEAFVKNSGFTAARISFVDNDHYEVSFKDAESDEWVKDESEHRYMTMSNSLYLFDEPEFKEKQAEYFNLKSAGLNYSCSPMCFAQQKLAYDLFSKKEWCVTMVNYQYKDGWDVAYFFPVSTSECVFLENWTEISDSSNPLDGNFGFITRLEKAGSLEVGATAKLHPVE